MQLVSLGKVAVPIPGTPVLITAAIITAAGGALPPGGGVAMVEMQAVVGNTGNAYVKAANGLVIAPLVTPSGSYAQAWRISAPGGNTVDPLSLAVDADNAGDGAYVSLWID